MRIKQFLLLFSLFGVLSSCNSSKVIVDRKIMTKENDPMLIGQVTKRALTHDEDFEWFMDEYNAYTPNKEVLKRIKNRIRNRRIEIFFGTWDHNSKEQLPKIIKILDEVNFPQKNLHMYALNRKMESFYGEQAQKAIMKTPTIIIFKGFKESGRIIEKPKESFEQDLYKIVTEQSNSSKK